MPLTASEMWRAKCMKIAGKLINWSRLSNTLNIICKVVFLVCAFQEDLFYQRQSAEFHSAVAATPKTQPESLLESVGIPGCTCREPGIPCVCTRLIALEKEAIFVPKHAVVQVKSTQITISVVFRLLSLSFTLQRFACTLLLTWASSTACDALLGCSAQGRGVCCRNGWSLLLGAISPFVTSPRYPYSSKQAFGKGPVGQRWNPAVQHRSEAGVQGLSFPGDHPIACPWLIAEHLTRVLLLPWHVEQPLGSGGG